MCQQGLTAASMLAGEESLGSASMEMTLRQGHTSVTHEVNIPKGDGSDGVDGKPTFRSIFVAILIITRGMEDRDTDFTSLVH